MALTLLVVCAAAALGGALGATVFNQGAPGGGSAVAGGGGRTGPGPRTGFLTGRAALASPTAPGTGAAAGSDPAAFYAGRALAGNGDTAVSLARAEQLGATVPAGAILDRSSNTLRFTSATVSFAVLASPPEHDMKFQIAGLTDPTVEVPPGAHVSIEFLNGDSDMAHMWLLGAGAPADAKIGARPLGDPTSTGQPAETITFIAPAAGTYQYYCGFPGHALRGMHGRFMVERS